MTEATSAPAEGGDKGGNTGAAGGDQQTATQPFAWATDATVKGYVQNKGWKSEAELLQSYQGLEKLVGGGLNDVVRLPKDDNAEAWSQVYERLGRPKDPKGYELPLPKEGADPQFAEWAKGAFHAAGLSTRQAAALTEAWNKFAGEKVGASAQEQQQALGVEQAKLKTEWGQNFNQNVEIAKRAARAFGLKPETVDKLESQVGFADTMRFLLAVGTRVGTDDTFIAGESKPGGFGMTKEQAGAKKAALMADKGWTAKWRAGDVTARREIAELDRILAA